MTGTRPGETSWGARCAALLLATLCALFSVLGPSPVHAEGEDEAAANPGTTWMVQPSGPDGPNERSYFVYGLDPGQQVQDTIRITNISEDEITLGLLSTDAFNVPESGAFDLLPTAEQPVDVGSWVTLPVNQVTIAPGTSVDVPFVVTVPANATPGDHVGGIVTSLTSPGTDAAGNAVLFDARIAVRMYLTVSGELAPNLEVEDLTVDYSGNGHQLTGTVTVSYTIRNRGNVRLAADETVSVAGLVGPSVGDQTSEIPELLPGGAVQRTVVLEDVPALVRLQATVALDPIDVGENLTTAPEPIEASESMWAVPWIPLLILLVLGAGLFYLIRGRRRRWKAMKDELEAARTRPGTKVDSEGGSNPGSQDADQTDDGPDESVGSRASGGEGADARTEA